MTLTKEQLSQLVNMLACCQYKDAAPIIQFLEKLLQEQAAK
jgi:hypothetical protein